MSRTGDRFPPQEELPFRIEIWNAAGRDKVERVLACALNETLGRAIFKAAQTEYPERRITLSKGDRIIAETSV